MRTTLFFLLLLCITSGCHNSKQVTSGGSTAVGIPEDVSHSYESRGSLPLLGIASHDDKPLLTVKDASRLKLRPNQVINAEMQEAYTAELTPKVIEVSREIIEKTYKTFRFPARKEVIVPSISAATKPQAAPPALSPKQSNKVLVTTVFSVLLLSLLIAFLTRKRWS